jgi:hypothetical protein
MHIAKMFHSELLPSTGRNHLSLYLKIQKEESFESIEENLLHQLKILESFVDQSINFKHKEKLLAPFKEILLPQNRHLFDNKSFQQFCFFRNQHNFYFFKINDPLETISVASKSFHLKPLIKYFNSHIPYLFLKNDPHHSDLLKGYWGNKLVDKIRIQDEFSEFQLIEKYIEESKRLRIPFYSLGLKKKNFLSLKNLKSHHHLEEKLTHLNHGEHTDEERIHSFIKKDIIHHGLVSNEKNFNHSFDFEKILTMASKGEIKEAYFHHDSTIFGKITKDWKIYDLSLFQQDNEDDDIFDDLSQLILSKGGKVFFHNFQETNGDQDPGIFFR